MKAVIAHSKGILVLPADHFGLGDYFALVDVATRHELGSNVRHVYDYFGPVDLISMSQSDLAAAVSETPDELLSIGKAIRVLTEGIYEASDPLVRLYLVDPLYTPYQIPPTPVRAPVVH